MTILVDVNAAEPGVVTRGALRLRVPLTGLMPGASVVLSIRPHEIGLVTRGQCASPEHNVLTGVVQRASYLGDAVDYQIRLSGSRSEEHTSELQSRPHLVCRLLLEKKKQIITMTV